MTNIGNRLYIGNYCKLTLCMQCFFSFSKCSETARQWSECSSSFFCSSRARHPEGCHQLVLVRPVQPADNWARTAARHLPATLPAPLVENGTEATVDQAPVIWAPCVRLDALASATKAVDIDWRSCCRKPFQRRIESFSVAINTVMSLECRRHSYYRNFWDY